MRVLVFFACAAAALTASGSALAGKKLDSIFQTDMLNVRVNYLETITGPAKRVMPWRSTEFREYVVDGCTLRAWTEKGNVVQYELPLNSKCQADLTRLMQQSMSTKGLTIGKFQEVSGDLLARADCLSLCGNAADPVASFIWEGPRALGFVQVSLKVTLASDAALNASERWQRAMSAKEGEDFVIEAKFNCTDKYNEVALDAFKNVLVTDIGFGYLIVSEEYNSDCKR